MAGGRRWAIAESAAFPDAFEHLSRAEQRVEQLSRGFFVALLVAFSLLSNRWQQRLGRWLGRLGWRLDVDAARTTRINLAACLPELDEPTRTALGRRSLEHTAALIAEAGAIYRWPERRWRRLTVSIEGAELLKRRGEGGSGVLVLVPHFGNWEYLALILGRYRVTALYERPRLRSLEPLIRQARTRAGATLLPISAGGLKRLYRTLADGGVVALLPDQVPHRRAGVYADFFDRRALTMTLAHRLLQRTGAQVVLGAAIRCKGGFRVRFVEMDHQIRDPDPVVSATALNRSIETLVRTDPAQYQWEYKRFKRQPKGSRSLYLR